MAGGAEDTWTVGDERTSGVWTNGAREMGCASPSAMNLRTLLSTRMWDAC